ncbi:LXG domain-containing protein [Metabacillus sp. FJAT-52054]|uniref:LXG domain-containing protein n=1 Tax=Metabacillus sediminis TaxID=3117746 RepID=A0ABZ2NHD9_9BACI
MKTLDVESLSQGIKTALAEIKSQKEQLKKMEADVKSIENLHTALTGKGGQAIRSFYGETHKPLLAYYDFLFENYERVLKKMKKDLTELEPEKNGVIKQSFLEGELTQGLNETKNYTSDLTDEANGIIDTIKSIAPVSNLDDSGVAGKVSDGKKDMEETLKQLTEYDQTQTSELTTVDQDVQKLKSYVSEISGMYESGKLSVGGYVPGQLSKNKNYDSLKSDLLIKRLMNVGDTTMSVLDNVGKSIGNGDYALMGFQLISTGLTTKFSSKLKVKYKGGIKPGFWDRVRGNYKFTVQIDREWTAKGKHRNPHAKWLKNFAEQATPTNPIKKLAHQFIKSYDSPSHLVKHAAGYPKNFNGWLDGKTFLKGYEKRIGHGIKGLVKDTLNAKGFTTVAKRVPYVSYAVSAAGNVGEFFSAENAKKSVMERSGRMVAGIGTDIVAISAGAKIGAIAGTAIGGPVGTVVGGAVGGLVGGIASSVVGDKIKDVGEAAGRAIEKEAKKITNNVTNSVIGWFN